MSNAKSLTEEQIAQVRSWAADGEEISDIQRRLKEEFSLRFTYLEMRFLLEDLKIEIVRPPEPEPEAPEEECNDYDADEQANETTAPNAEGAEAPAGAVRVKVSVDHVLRPGALMSGKAEFPGNNTISWWLDQMGRLGMDAADPEFRPSEEEIYAFQMELRKVLQGGGY